MDFTTGLVTLANSGTAAITCNTSCNVTGGSAFPSDSFPLYVWTVTVAGGWDLSQGTFDKRAAFSTAPDGVGANLSLTVVNGKSTIAYDPTSGLTPTGAFDASGASLTRPNRMVANDPSGTCPSNQEVVLSSASGNLFSCLAGSWHGTAGGGGTTAAWSSTLRKLDSLARVYTRASRDRWWRIRSTGWESHGAIHHDVQPHRFPRNPLHGQPLFAGLL